MAREFIISTYLFLFQILFNMFKLFPQKKKTVCVASFGDNIFHSARSLRSLSDEDIVILKDASCKFAFDESIGNIISFDIKHPIDYLQSIYHLATASTILVDNYFGFLAVTNFKQHTICIQLWHAAGAIKQFGLMDPSVETRTEKAKNRFQKVYNRFDYAIVGSEKMASVFQKSFGLSNESILRTGIPRTDVFYDQEEKQRIYQNIKQKFPMVKDKKIILYAPTFRQEQLSDCHLDLDIKQLYEELSEDYVLFIKPHPAVSYSLNQEYGKFAYDVSDFNDTNALLLITDILITDYSSIPFEYALLEKPMIFYAYDMEEYKIKSGLMEDYENQMPGPVLFSTEAIIRAIKQNEFDFNRIKYFAGQWNEYSNGKSSLQLAKVVVNKETKEKEKAFV